MRKKILMLLLSVCCLTLPLFGCGEEVDIATLTPEDYEPACFEFDKEAIEEEKLPDDMYYIVREGKETVKYYPLYSACETSITEAPVGAQGSDPSRIIWVNYNVDEGLIPTLKSTDTLIYKSHTSIPTTYAMEKFYDLGYTIGVAGLVPDISGNYRYLSVNNESGTGTGRVYTNSDAVGFDTLTAENIYLVSVGDEKITNENINIAGAVSGLELMKKYECDVREGTTKNPATLTANIRLFSSAETYMFSDFEFITPYIARINIPEYMTTGYYCVGASGFFKYEDGETEGNNKTIYTYDEYGALNGALVNDELKKFDESGFIIDYSAKRDENDFSQEKPIVARTKNENGYFEGDLYIQYVSKPKTNSAGQYYDINAISLDGTESVQLRYYSKEKKLVDLEIGNTCQIEYYLEDSGDNYGYGIIKHYELTGRNVPEPIPPEEEDIPEEETDGSSTEIDADKLEGIELQLNEIDDSTLESANLIYDSLTDSQKEEMSNIDESDSESVRKFYNSLTDEQKKEIMDKLEK